MSSVYLHHQVYIVEWVGGSGGGREGGREGREEHNVLSIPASPGIYSGAGVWEGGREGRDIMSSVYLHHQV